MNQKRLRSRAVIHRDHLVERYAPAATVIGPEPHNRREMALGPTARLRPVLLAERQRRPSVQFQPPARAFAD